jgi:Peptidase family M28
MIGSVRVALLCSIAVAACSRSQEVGSLPSTPVVQRGLEKTEAALKQHTTVLASDAYEGRLPGSRGDTLSVAYIIKQFRQVGLRPAAPGGGFEQPVPLVTRHVDATATFRGAGRVITVQAPDQMFMRDVAPGTSGVHGSHVIFVGFGIVAPARRRDDYHGQDIRGQVVMMLVGSPPATLSDTTRIPQVTWGPEATGEGKIAAARARGATAIIFVFDSALTGNSFSQVAPLYGDRAIRSDTVAATPITALYLAPEASARVLAAAGRDLDDLEKQAGPGTMAPLTLDLDVAVRSDTRLRRFTSPNVIGQLDGADPARRGQVVVFTAHWDHLGRDTTLKGDQIYNGAVDNAGGVAQLIEVARTMSRPPRPPRTLLFIATTAEEEAQLGAAYYVAHPSYPLAHTVANINLDFFEPWGRTRDVINYGPTGSTLDDILAAVARKGGRTVAADPTPEENFWQRGDQYRFALTGVPSVFPAPGIHYVGRTDAYGPMKGQEYTEHDYHQVSDEVRSDWDWSGAVQEVGFLAEVGFAVASDSAWPTWKDTTMCPACRERGAELVHGR